MSQHTPRTMTAEREAEIRRYAKELGLRNTVAILAEIDAERAVSAELLEACKGVLKLIDDGQLVRNTSNDANPDWAMRQLPFVLALKKATKAIHKAEPSPSDSQGSIA